MECPILIDNVDTVVWSVWKLDPINVDMIESVGNGSSALLITFILNRMFAVVLTISGVLTILL